MRFEEGLHSMHLWYSHPFTHVLLVTTPLPDDPAGAAAYTNRRSYEERGWCFFEMQISSLVKNADVLWDLRHFDGKSHSYDAMRAQLRAELEHRPRPLPPLDACGTDPLEFDVDNCARNSVFYKNLPAYSRALSGLITRRIELPVQ